MPKEPPPITFGHDPGVIWLFGIVAMRRSFLHWPSVQSNRMKARMKRSVLMASMAAAVLFSATGAQATHTLANTPPTPKNTAPPPRAGGALRLPGRRKQADRVLGGTLQRRGRSGEEEVEQTQPAGRADARHFAEPHSAAHQRHR